MRILGIIPSRFHSTRFPGKPLKKIAGKFMIQRVYEQCLKCDLLDDVIIATDHEEIEQAAKNFGAKVIMTSSNHVNGTSRCFEAATLFNHSVECVINIQGDEPFIDPTQIDLLADLIVKDDISIATLVRPIDDREMLANSNVVKAVMSNTNKVLYFSRSSIPFHFKKSEEITNTFYSHIGIYAYKMSVLKKLIQLPEGALEKSERLEQLRWLEAGYNIHAAITNSKNYSVDVPEDIDYINQLIAKGIIIP
ncbi:MAG TPA: 3-deoxy-manno-octulosonate cytidylyltransferase [Bacteroidia bacterium]|nr:3-deoxy-manno-octulosonate cytidylyltransferase [Bacteroidia bacterium]HNT79446.1 3-deoxy-manno-octulosonate cytidylyltransferase [Bacteroidia bacterium]